MKICINVKATQSLISTEVVQTFKKLETSTAAFCWKESKTSLVLVFVEIVGTVVTLFLEFLKTAGINSIHISSQTMYCFGIR